MPSSYYPDDRRTDDYDRDRKHSHRPRSPVYEEEEIIEARRRPKGSGDKSLIPRARDRDDDSDSVEEIRRDHIPGGSRGDDRPPRRARSAREKKSSRRYDDYSSDSESPPPRRRRDDRRRECVNVIDEFG